MTLEGFTVAEIDAINNVKVRRCTIKQDGPKNSKPLSQIIIKSY